MNANLTDAKDFQLPDMSAVGEFSNEELMEDSAGLQVSFQRVKIPGGGTLQFEITGDDPENPEYAKAVEGVILYNHDTNAFWPNGNAYDENTNPLCSSVDGITGIGNPGGACAACPMNAFGSGENGRGKACKNMRILYILQSGEYMPIQLTLPPTSRKPFGDFVSAAFIARKRASYGSVTQIWLTRKNNGKDDYSVATFRRIGDFEGETLAQIKGYSESFRLQIKAMLETKALYASVQTNEMAAIPENAGGDFSYEASGALPASA
jgi:hypothetical protein